MSLASTVVSSTAPAAPAAGAITIAIAPKPKLKPVPLVLYIGRYRRSVGLVVDEVVNDEEMESEGGSIYSANYTTFRCDFGKRAVKKITFKCDPTKACSVIVSASLGPLGTVIPTRMCYTPCPDNVNAKDDTYEFVSEDVERRNRQPIRYELECTYDAVLKRMHVVTFKHLAAEHGEDYGDDQDDQDSDDDEDGEEEEEEEEKDEEDDDEDEEDKEEEEEDDESKAPKRKRAASAASSAAKRVKHAL